MFKIITYPKLVYEWLRNYFSVNADGELSLMYRFITSIVYSLQDPFNAYDIFRRKKWLISQCSYTVGQLQSVLNMLYDSMLNRITVTQSAALNMYVYGFDDTNITYIYGFDDTDETFMTNFYNNVMVSNASINIPTSINTTDIVSVINQIKIAGVQITINWI